MRPESGTRRSRWRPTGWAQSCAADGQTDRRRMITSREEVVLPGDPDSSRTVIFLPRQMSTSPLRFVVSRVGVPPCPHAPEATDRPGPEDREVGLLPGA